MQTFNSATARQHFSEMLEVVNNEDIKISKNNKDVAVLLSCKRYEELKRLEDILYAKAAELAIEEGFISVAETKELLDDINK